MSMPPPPPPPGAVPPPPPGYQPYQAYQAAPQYAGFGARLGALIIHALVPLVLVPPGYVILLAGKNSSAAGALGGLLALGGAIAFLVLYCKKVSQGQSWGHKATGIRVVDANSGQSLSPGRVFGRQLARILSGFLCYLGYFWMLWDPKKQTWHDKILNTIVVTA